jgi:NAD-dependent dihydropyrimidine dehydrogenase PreA subunit
MFDAKDQTMVEGDVCGLCVHTCPQWSLKELDARLVRTDILNIIILDEYKMVVRRASDEREY